MKTIHVLIALSLAVSPLTSGVAPAHARRALLIGNANYRALNRLAGPVNDIRDMNAVLEAAGFSSTLIGNASHEAMDRAAAEFTAGLKPGDVALIFYSGFGVEIDGENYLIPVDMPEVADETQLKYRSFPVRRLIDSIHSKDASLEIVVLDTCRDNPFAKGNKGIGPAGLAPMYGGLSTFIAYASAPGQTAGEKDGNGIFTRELVKQLRVPGLEMKEAFARAGAATFAASEGRQSPWFTHNVYEPFYFAESRK